ncbi:MAG: hypothetical protein ACETWO_04970 [Candidatus Hadarchaeaceae archaeon]|nr:ribbon-helix-helix domain-containing protein [Hadesarchaea archaeon]MDH5685822.1 ribbon-helix-helix domain-containing protein [Hadesarchaea archaeon]
MMVQKKAEVRVFVDGIYLKVIDDLIGTGYGGNRSEVVRKMIHDWVMTNIGGFQGLMKYSKGKR